MDNVKLSKKITMDVKQKTIILDTTETPSIVNANANGLMISCQLPLRQNEIINAATFVAQNNLMPSDTLAVSFFIIMVKIIIKPDSTTMYLVLFANFVAQNFVNYKCKHRT